MPIALLRRMGFAREPADARERGLLEAIDAELESLPSGRAELVATFAALLARVAYADQEISEAESTKIEELVVEQGGLSAHEAAAVALIARNKTIALGGSENHLLTRRFNDLATPEDKRRLVDCLYAVATADELVTLVEDREIRRIALALLMSPSELLEIRAPYREQLEEIQELRRLRGERS